MKWNYKPDPCVNIDEGDIILWNALHIGSVSANTSWAILVYVIYHCREASIKSIGIRIMNRKYCKLMYFCNVLVVSLSGI